MEKLFLFLLPIILYAQVIDTVVPLSDSPLNMFYVPSGNELYINGFYGNCFYVLDCSTYQIKKVIPKGGTYISRVYGTWNWHRDKLYFSTIFPDSILVINNQTDSIIKWIALRANQPCYNSKDDKIYVSTGCSLAVIDCETDSIIKIIPPQPHQLSRFTLWDSIGDKIYCGTAWSDKVTVINCSNDSVIKFISTGITPAYATYNLQSRKLYVCGDGLVVIDAVRDSLIKSLDVWFGGYDPPIWNEVEDKLYYLGPDSLYVIDCRNDSIIKAIDFGGTMGLARWSNYIYIPRDTWVGHWEGYVRVLDCYSDSFIARIPDVLFAHEITTNPQARRIYISGDSVIYVIRDDIQGISEIASPNRVAMTTSIEVYPNPARSFLAIRLPYIADRQMIKIFDVSGKLVKIADKVTSPQSHKQELRISLKGINPGIYFLRFGSETRKFLAIR